MRFRKLSKEEFELLEKEFIDFLVSNTITADDWKEIKENKLNEALELMDMFSDIVMEKVYSKITLLEKREKKSVLLFKFEGDIIYMLGVSVNDETIDFTQSETLNNVKNVAVQGFRNTKVVAKDAKLDEIHSLINSGCQVSDESIYNLLDSIIE